MVDHSSSLKYAETSQRLIQQAEDELRAGDLLQASEKAWGAAALAVKSVAAQRGWRHNNHALLYDISDQIADELRRPELGRLFRSASTLHTNFYEDWMAEGNVQGGIEDANTYLREMATVMATPSAFVPQTPAQTARLRRLTRTP